MPGFSGVRLLLFLVVFNLLFRLVGCGRAAERLYEDVMSNHNGIVRPVPNPNQTLDVYLNLKLTQIVSVVSFSTEADYEKAQVITTNVFVLQEWVDHSLTWDPDAYEGIEHFYVPAQLIWLPDIVLYNNADGNYQITTLTKALVHHSGKVVWRPPAVYKSYCEMNMEWFPYDEQECVLKFGFWSYDGVTANLVHWRGNEVNVSRDQFGYRIWIVDNAFDLTDYYPSAEWEIMSAPAIRHSVKYPCCEAPFVDVTYVLKLRRKTLFYTVNLVIPIIGISYLTILVFLLPADSGEKITTCISVMLALTVFFLLLAEMIPSTSIVIPLIGKYLLFTMVLVTGSVGLTIGSMNVYYRCDTNTVSPRMPQWIRVWFLDRLPRVLFMRRFDVNDWSPRGLTNMLLRVAHNLQFSMEMYAKAMKPKKDTQNGGLPTGSPDKDSRPAYMSAELKQKLERVAASVNFITDRLRSANDDKEMADEWRYVSMVLDKLLLLVYVLACVGGTFIIVLRAPRWRDSRVALA